MTPFGQMGARAVPVLQRELAAERDGVMILGILNVFREMQRLGTYDVRREPELMSNARGAVERIEDPIARARGFETFRDIEEGP